MESVPETWLEALAVGGKLVVPVGAGDVQELTLFERLDSGVRRTVLGKVRYVADRR
jgi:protein-L-isoaspartate(D-aspartate) O-methyltransferase